MENDLPDEIHRIVNPSVEYQVVCFDDGSSFVAFPDGSHIKIRENADSDDSEKRTIRLINQRINKSYTREAIGKQELFSLVERNFWKKDRHIPVYSTS
jgi:hypothetical protein